MSGPRTTYAIGDVHGRLDLLNEALDFIDYNRRGERARVVTLGDYIDRGPHSAMVVRRLRNFSGTPMARSGVELICLKGNHEDMMHRVVARADTGLTDVWFGNGGRQTMESYADDDDSVVTMLKDVEWMGELPTCFDDGDRHFVHAGVRLEVRSLDRVSDEDRLWIREDFLDNPRIRPVDRHLGRVIVHGHTPCKFREQDQGWRVNLDTRAYSTGVLSVGRWCDGAFDIVRIKSSKNNL